MPNNDNNLVQKEFLIYSDENGDVKVNVMLINDDLWLTQDLIAELFGKDRSVITKHINNIFEEQELDEKSNVQKMHFANSDKPVKIYNLNVIIAVGYRVNSKKATQFRIWATTVQNKFHYAITGNTAPEIIYKNADSKKENMGLTTWKHSPDGRILKSDVIIAKNYLSEKQIKQLERTVSGYFDYIEDLIERENTFTMKEFSESINAFLEFRRYDILKDKGTISRKQAEEKAEIEYNKFNKTQKIKSDFDKLLLETKELKNNQ